MALLFARESSTFEKRKGGAQFPFARRQKKAQLSILHAALVCRGSEALLLFDRS